MTPRATPAAPDEAPSRLRDTDLRLLVSHIDAALADGGRPSVASLAAAVGLAPVVLRQRLEATLGIGPRALLSGRQLARLRERLLAGDDVTDALYSAGYGSSSRLYERAQEGLGMTPGAYRRGGAGVAIGWTTAPSPLGLLLVATTAHGVCAVYLGDSEATLRAALDAEFPRATITRGVEPQRVGRGGCRRRQWTGARRRTARPAGHGVPAARLAGVAGHSPRRDPHLCATGGDDRAADGGACGRTRVRHQQGLPARPLPPCRRQRCVIDRLPVGRRAEAAPARDSNGAQRSRARAVHRLRRPAGCRLQAYLICAFASASADAQSALACASVSSASRAKPSRR